MRILGDGRIVTEGQSTYSPSFSAFVSSADPSFKSSSGGRYPKSVGEGSRTVTDKAYEALFHVYGRKGTYHFNLGNSHNIEYNVVGLIQRYGDAHSAEFKALSKNQQVSWILKKQPNIYEGKPDEDERVFIQPVVNTDKRNWAWYIGDSTVVVHKGPKQTAEA